MTDTFPNYIDGAIDWSLGSANQPATGATYYVTEASASDPSIIHSGYSLSGNTLTFSAAPGAR